VSVEIAGLAFALVDQMLSYFAQVAADFDLTPPHGRLIVQLDDEVPMGQLADYLRCDASNITGIVDRLERRDLVVRRVDPTDRRVKRIALTTAGRELRVRLEARLAGDRPSVASLSGPDQLALRDLLRRALGR
jgi:DNA-binding MarR family transcriptional regulator